MYQYTWDAETGGLLLTSETSKFSKEPRPVYYRELDILGFDAYWNYPRNDEAPIMWAEANNYIYRGRKIASTKGGSLYTRPELVVLEESPEPDGMPLRPVDVEEMCRRNADLMETLVQETIQKIYNTYLKYRDRIDVFYVAFSGGKDSVVTLDLVQRALPHDQFKVVFGNTDMEFPTTLALVEAVQQDCAAKRISFYTASAPFSSQESWRTFGPPARKNRWCCTVHKTAPVVNLLCDIYGLKKLKAMMLTGVRADESVARSEYDDLSIGKKLSGQYSFHPILDWSSSEVFLYIYRNNLLLNEAYKMGFNRVGCIMCPNSTDKHEFIKQRCFPTDVDIYSNIIIETSRKDLSGDNAHHFLETGGWKTRYSGRELRFHENDRFEFEEGNGILRFRVVNLNSEWKEWYKTIGQIDDKHPEYLLEYAGTWRKCHLSTEGIYTIFNIENEVRSKNSIDFVSFFRSILAKSQYCIRCKTCVAECPFRNISMDGNKLSISDKCVRCHECLKVLNGCLVYNSIRGSKDVQSVKGINRYLSIGVDYEWIKQYAADHEYEPGNRKTDTMFSFLVDANMVATRTHAITEFGEFAFKFGIDKLETWALMVCNLVYATPFKWYVLNIPFDEEYTEDNLAVDMSEATAKARGEFWNGFKIL
ncbi:MAG: phosphoadenosine phosphosulfate reductase family protein [Clostridia bacterium]|nr:phosphoadenosine phosphosulfate reductase family protein [Clostridia bacterium]